MTTTAIPKRPMGNIKQAKLLVIEDNDDHWAILEKTLNQSIPEFTYERVDSPEMALSLLQEWTTQEWELPKLILQDLYLPTREAGWHLARQIKAMAPVCNRIPLVVLSSSADPADVREAYQSGISSYMVKPVTFSDWLAAFRELRSFWWDTVTLPPMQFSC